MDDYRKSFLSVLPQPYPPHRPSLGHNSVPNLPGPKMLDLQLKISFVIPLNGQDLRWHLQQPRCVQDPTTLTQTSIRVYQNYSNKDRSTPANCSTMELPTMDCSLVAPTALGSTLILLTTELSSQAHLTSFLTKTNNKLFK